MLCILIKLTATLSMSSSEAIGVDDVGFVLISSVVGNSAPGSWTNQYVLKYLLMRK